MVCDVVCAYLSSVLGSKMVKFLASTYNHVHLWKRFEAPAASTLAWPHCHRACSLLGWPPHVPARLHPHSWFLTRKPGEPSVQSIFVVTLRGQKGPPTGCLLLLGVRDSLSSVSLGSQVGCLVLNPGVPEGWAGSQNTTAVAGRGTARPGVAPWNLRILPWKLPQTYRQFERFNRLRIW